MNAAALSVPVWVEPFAGTASVACMLHTGRPPRFGYLGSKRWLAARTLAALGLVPGGRAGDYALNDPGDVGLALATLSSPAAPDVIAAVAAVAPGPEAWGCVAADPVPEDPALRAACWLVLQNGAHLYKPVRAVGGTWQHPGYGHLSDLARRKGFRWRSNPPALARRVAAWSAALRDMQPRVSRVAAADLEPEPCLAGSCCYIDPPYPGTTPYPGVPDPSVETVARRHLDAGYVVAVAGREPFEIPGARVAWLDADADRRRMVKRRRECVTVVTP